ncbi:MAG TPA: polysaccharide deacetylase family protein [Pyrinomonadaceae bacterium]|nr:polysaccharide deacetylase family protein [Pyrinomonadaceae bacterium]
MKRTLLIVLLFAVVVPLHAQTPVRTIAVTIDDLPYVTNSDEIDYLTGARVATAKILNTLKKHKAPAVGFVNERMLGEAKVERDARIALLRDWVKYGMVLGNHTYSHPDLNLLTVEQFQEEITKGEVVSRQLMKSRRPYQLYFRHPFTHTGDTREKKEAIERFLAERGYKITPHTIENSDWMFDRPYVRALQKGDKELAQRLRETYLEFTIGAAAFAEKVSPQIFGREIPQILLIHSNDITADSLDEILRRLAARGYRFVTLDKVMSDPAYETKDTFVTKHGPTWFVRWAQSKGLNVSFRDDADPPKWVMDLSRQP